MFFPHSSVKNHENLMCDMCFRAVLLRTYTDMQRPIHICIRFRLALIILIFKDIFVNVNLLID